MFGKVLFIRKTRRVYKKHNLFIGEDFVVQGEIGQALTNNKEFYADGKILRNYGRTKKNYRIQITTITNLLDTK